MSRRGPRGRDARRRHQRSSPPQHQSAPDKRTATADGGQVRRLAESRPRGSAPITLCADLRTCSVVPPSRGSRASERQSRSSARTEGALPFGSASDNREGTGDPTIASINPSTFAAKAVRRGEGRHDQAFWNSYVHVPKLKTLRAAYDLAKWKNGPPSILTNRAALESFRSQVGKGWLRAPRRRGQRTCPDWTRMDARQRVPSVAPNHPPFASRASTSEPEAQPSAVPAHAWIQARSGPSLPVKGRLHRHRAPQAACAYHLSSFAGLAVSVVSSPPSASPCVLDFRLDASVRLEEDSDHFSFGWLDTLLSWSRSWRPPGCAFSKEILTPSRWP